MMNANRLTATVQDIQGDPKIGTLFRTPYNFIRYWPIFKLFSLSESRENFQ